MTASISIAKNKLNTDLTVSTTKYIFRKEKVSTKAAENYTHIEVYTARFDAAHSARGGLYIFYVNVEHKQQLRHYARHVYINQDVNGFAYKYNGIYYYVKWEDVKNGENPYELRFCDSYANIISKKVVPLVPANIVPVSNMGTLLEGARDVFYGSSFI